MRYYDAEFHFPDFRQEDKTQELKNIAFCEAMSWFSHKRATEMAVQQMKVQSYSYEDEMVQIKTEKDQGIMFSKEFAQVLKGEDESKQPAGMTGGFGQGVGGGRPTEGMAGGEFGANEYDAPEDEYDSDVTQGTQDMAQNKDKAKTMSTKKATNMYPNEMKI